MLAYLARRLLQSVAVTFVVLSLVFVAGRILGDPVRLVVGIEASEERVQRVREQLNLNQPLGQQYANFIGDALSLQFGTSFWQKVPALPRVLERIPATLTLTAAALALALPLGITLGALSALRPWSRIDRVTNVISLGGVSIVEFWLALMLILIFPVRLGWFKTSGYGGIEYFVLPALTLCYKPLGRIAQITRSAMLDELAKPYVKAARARGLAERRVVFVHALKNAAVPVLTISGDELAALLNGAIIVETVFGWPGIGRLTIQALERRDLPMVEATVFVVAIFIIVTNLLVDMAYTWLNPRIRFSAAGDA
ncbi:MAG: ABC transporter permease [Anaerolineaceae bacterium]|nr:ABC transporter permease [Anaerolineaceae bacterium]MDE0327613.1 ABC transporter permease [Anaerolineaceae bacterium]MDE0610749.1 ABC transporter permease [Anaerolineaceae bacterium]